jgi:hypothetical protein
MPFGGGFSRRVYKPGEVIRFTYRWHTGATPEESKVDFKEVLVLHGNWLGKMHGIDLKRLTEAERVVLRTIMDKEMRKTVPGGSFGTPLPHPIPLVNDILRRMDPTEEIKNPVAFYSKFVKVFIRNKDAYRTYFPRRMWSVTVVKKTDVRGAVINPNPLFKKSEIKPKEPVPPTGTAPGRIDLIKQRAQRLGMIRQQHQAAQGGKVQRPRVERPKIQKPPRPR